MYRLKLQNYHACRETYSETAGLPKQIQLKKNYRNILLIWNFSKTIFCISNSLFFADFPRYSKMF